MGTVPGPQWPDSDDVGDGCRGAILAAAVVLAVLILAVAVWWRLP
jgi:hypothetical protein